MFRAQQEFPPDVAPPAPAAEAPRQVRDWLQWGRIQTYFREWQNANLGRIEWVSERLDNEDYIFVSADRMNGPIRVNLPDWQRMCAAYAQVAQPPPGQGQGMPSRFLYEWLRGYQAARQQEVNPN